MADLLTTAEVASILGTSVRTVSRWVKAGRLPVAQTLPGDRGANLFDPAAVELYRSEVAS